MLTHVICIVNDQLVNVNVFCYSLCVDVTGLLHVLVCVSGLS
jgi:hypothetical protein